MLPVRELCWSPPCSSRSRHAELERAEIILDGAAAPLSVKVAAKTNALTSAAGRAVLFPDDYEEFHEWRGTHPAKRGVCRSSRAGKYKKLLRG